MRFLAITVRLTIIAAQHTSNVNAIQLRRHRPLDPTVHEQQLETGNAYTLYESQIVREKMRFESYHND